MGLNFRKSFKIAPGVRINIGKKGVSSVSVGGKGARVNVGRKGTRSTISAPGTGLSYSTFSAHEKSNKSSNQKQINPFASQMPPPLPVAGHNAVVTERKVSFLLGAGIVVMPYIFAWLTLRQGHSNLSRVVSFSWMILLLVSL